MQVLVICLTIIIYLIDIQIAFLWSLIIQKVGKFFQLLIYPFRHAEALLRAEIFLQIIPDSIDLYILFVLSGIIIDNLHIFPGLKYRGIGACQIPESSGAGYQLPVKLQIAAPFFFSVNKREEHTDAAQRLGVITYAFTVVRAFLMV